MELQEAKDYVFQLMKDKDKIESELKALQEVLDTVCISKHNIASYQTLVYVTRNERNLRICKQHDLSFSRILPSVYVFFYRIMSAWMIRWWIPKDIHGTISMFTKSDTRDIK